MAASEINVVRALARNRYSTTATMADAAISLPLRLPIDDSMKSAWRKVTWGASMPGGRVFCKSFKAASIWPVSLTVSASGCFCTLSTTAGLPLKPASPRLMAAAKVTSATCRSSKGRPSRVATGRRSRSASLLVRPMLRIRYSRPLSSRKPPLVLAE